MRLMSIVDFREKWELTLKVMLIVVLPGLLVQYYVRLKGWNILDMDIIIASLLTGAVFLIGFMLVGILQDFKESEQLLNNIANSILSVQDHNRTEPNKAKKKAMLKHLLMLAKSTRDWLEDKMKVDKVYALMDELSIYSMKFDNKNCTSWLEENQKSLRQTIMRIDIIKNTMFLKAGYSIMEIISAAVIVLILFSKTDTFILGAATYAASSFTLVYMILLIKDMDDPFQFDSNEQKMGAAEVSMIPIDTTLKLLEKEMDALKGN